MNRSRSRVLAAATTIAACAGALLLPTQAQAAGSVHLYKIYYDSPGADRGGNTSLNAEYVEIRNTTGKAVSLKGWTIKDRTGYTYTFGTYSLGASKTVKVRTGQGSDTAANRYWNRKWYVWNNTGDTATLRKATGTKVDTCDYGKRSSPYIMC
ncbi:lamin tail domain-containing protein [Streptomyces sp. 549]|uniref:lamin tail domain-containing protein n=1 Tax=Streptomyces sp. 549 TaxID=3049076 RepID=UPI0024C2420E|nr:lamin tail domain-containing protein [Streptomyces sp. 549]MDK1473008.1 lamin tail domain-containing protein [Streptomyces sp. 549]